MIREFLTLTDGIRVNERNFDMALKGTPGFNQDVNAYIANIHARAVVIGGLANTLGAVCNHHVDALIEQCAPYGDKDSLLAMSEEIQAELAASATSNMNRIIGG